MIGLIWQLLDVMTDHILEVRIVSVAWLELAMNDFERL